MYLGKYGTHDQAAGRLILIPTSMLRLAAGKPERRVEQSIVDGNRALFFVLTDLFSLRKGGIVFERN